MKRRDPERMMRLASLIVPLLAANSDPVQVRAGEQSGTEEGTIICAWCRRLIGSQAGIAGESHGIRPECKQEQFPDPDTERSNLDAMAVQMNLLSYEGTKLVAVQPIDRLGNNQLEILVAHQKEIGREVIFELLW